MAGEIPQGGDNKDKTIYHEKVIEPLSEELQGSFQRVMQTLHPEPQLQEDVSMEIRAESYWIRGNLTMADIANVALRRNIDKADTELFLSNAKGQDKTIPELRLPNNCVLYDVSFAQIRSLDTDFSQLSRQEFSRNFVKQLSLWATIPVLAEREKGEEFGAEVKKHHDRHQEAMRREFRRNLGLAE
jgi:hypothetical protein